MTVLLQPGEPSNSDSENYWNVDAPADESAEDRVTRILYTLLGFYTGPLMGFSPVVNSARVAETPYHVTILGLKITAQPLQAGDRLLQVGARVREVSDSEGTSLEPLPAPDHRMARLFMVGPQASPEADVSNISQGLRLRIRRPRRDALQPVPNSLEVAHAPFPSTENELIRPLEQLSGFRDQGPEFFLSLQDAFRWNGSINIFGYHLANEAEDHPFNTHQWFAAQNEYFASARPHDNTQELSLPPAEALAHVAIHMHPARQQQIANIAALHGAMTAARVVRVALHTLMMEEILGFPEEITDQDEQNWQEIVNAVLADPTLADYQ